MKLSSIFVIEQLQRYYKISVPSELSATPCLIHPTLYTPGMKLQDYIVYVVNKIGLNDLEAYGEFPEHCLVIVIGRKPNYKSFNVCTLYGTNNALIVFSQIQELFNIYATWQENLIHTYLKDKSIQTMLSISIPVLKNSLFVVGMDFTILAAAFINSPNSYEDVFGSSQNTHSYVTALKNSELFHQVKELNNVFYFPSTVTGLASLCVNIKKNDKTTHRLVMLEDNRKIGKNEGFLLEFLALLIQRMLNSSLVKHLNPINNGYEYLTKIFLNILNNKNVDYLDIGQKLNAEGWLSNHEYICICIKLTKIDKRNYTYYPIILYLNKIFSNSCPLLYKGNIVVFINMTLSQLNLNELLKRAEGFAKESLLNVGISPSMSGHIHLRYQYIRAQIALSIGVQKSPKKRVHIFNDVSFDYILQQSTKELPAPMIAHEKLLNLINIDKTKNTEYVRTLYIYLDNQFNALQTAKKLFIHRSTLMYRLDKIKKILGSDLKDSDELLYIMLSFRLLGYRQEVKNSLYTIYCQDHNNN
ncbi:helix-turn-helix domain-containing protein [Schnuerera sp. xch1]|uniref:PucR family transcriptional regulator n=1 Tax=Schnuerera sp. xch1 TaxID=2874283 RepID=UPI001CC066C7|nr:helix-turn-helix domain-containing protein [Schnuerera sp. xch1]MBZ2174796.1 helix-turn-helix domain-containing protein [Schnuerera sp. xch1]